MTTSTSPFERLDLRSDHLASLTVDVGPVVTLGGGPYGERRVVAILGGRVAGPVMNGSVLPGGADWQVGRADGVLDIEAHYTLKLDDDALVEVVSSGMRFGPADVIARLGRGESVDPAEYFFRTFIRFQTGASAHLHLNRTMAVAVGTRRASAVELTLHRIN